MRRRRCGAALPGAFFISVFGFCCGGFCCVVFFLPQQVTTLTAIPPSNVPPARPHTPTNPPTRPPAHPHNHPPARTHTHTPSHPTTLLRRCKASLRRCKRCEVIKVLKYLRNKVLMYLDTLRRCDAGTLRRCKRRDVAMPRSFKICMQYYELPLIDLRPHLHQRA